MEAKKIADIVCNEDCVCLKDCADITKPNPFPTCPFVPILRGVINLTEIAFKAGQGESYDRGFIKGQSDGLKTGIIRGRSEGY